MRIVPTILSLLCLLVTMTPALPAEEQTWRGQISDDNCGPSHAKMLVQHKAGNQMTPEACVLACVATGAKYVFVMNGKVYKIANQNFPLLKIQAGHTVQLSGEMNGDTITISNLMVPPVVVRIPAT
jgi:hypothetical protein